MFCFYVAVLRQPVRQAREEPLELREGELRLQVLRERHLLLGGVLVGGDRQAQLLEGGRLHDLREDAQDVHEGRREVLALQHLLQRQLGPLRRRVRRHAGLWLRTNGVNTNGAAAEVMNFDGLGKKVRPGAFWKIKVLRLTGVKKFLCQKNITLNLRRPR